MYRIPSHKYKQVIQSSREPALPFFIIKKKKAHSPKAKGSKID